MPHSNGRIYSETVNGVKRGISLDDVGLTIGDSSRDVATLCMSKKINPAALFCPRYVMQSGIDLMVNGAFSADALAHIKAQTSQIRKNYTVGPYGVCIPEMQLNNFAQNSTAFDRVFACARLSWYIARPNYPTGNQTVTQTSFKAINHFDGYDQNVRVTPPVSLVTVQEAPNGDKYVTVTFVTKAADGKTLSVSNLFKGGGYYFGAIVFRGTNADGWLTTDVVHVSTCAEAIGESERSYTVTVIDDAQSNDGYYRVIPFVANKGNVQSVAGGGISAAFSGKVAYGTRIDDSCGSVFTVRCGGSSGGSSDVQNYVFTWKEGSNGNYYPVPGDKTFEYTIGNDGPGIAIYFSESSWYPQTGASTLAAALKRVDMIMPYTNDKGEHVEAVFTWYADTSKTSTLLRHTFPNKSGTENKLFFYIKPAQSTPILNRGLTDIIGRFYWIDGTTEELFSTYIPDEA